MTLVSPHKMLSEHLQEDMEFLHYQKRSVKIRLSHLPLWAALDTNYAMKYWTHLQISEVFYLKR